RQAIEVCVAFELDRGTPEAASAALAELEEPPPDLAARVTAALGAREGEKARVKRLERLDAQLDPATGRKTRLATGRMLAAVWSISPQLGPLIEAPHTPFGLSPMHAQLIWSVALVVIGFAIAFWGRDSLGKTLVNRRLRAIVMVSFALQLALEIASEMI